MTRLQDRDLRFRDAIKTDATALADIGRETFVETFGAAYTPRDLESYLRLNFSVETQTEEIEDDNTSIRVVEGGGRMIAYAKVAPVKLPVDTGDRQALELHRLYVMEARQGIGVGRILLSWAIEQARTNGAEDLYLGVWSENERAISVYRSRGFEVVGQYDLYVGNHVDQELIMRLDLTSMT